MIFFCGFIHAVSHMLHNTKFTNGGHISYVEVDGDPSNNLEAFEAIVRCMKEQHIGYGSINHPVDRSLACSISLITSACATNIPP